MFSEQDKLIFWRKPVELYEAFASSVRAFELEVRSSFADPHLLIVLDTSIGLLHSFRLACLVSMHSCVVFDTAVSSDHGC